MFVIQKIVLCSMYRIAVSTNNQISLKIYFRPQLCQWLSKLGGDTSILAGAPEGMGTWGLGPPSFGSHYNMTLF